MSEKSSNFAKVFGKRKRKEPMQRLKDILSKMGLLPQVLVAMVLGVLLSFVMPEWGIRCFATFNGLFANYMALVIPILIIALIVPSIFELGKGAGLLLVTTVLISYVLAVVGGFLGLHVGEWSAPYLLEAKSDMMQAAMSDSCKPYFTVEMPAFMHTTTAVVVAFILGLTLIRVRGNVIRRGMCELRDIINMVIEKSIIPLLPLYVFGSFLDLCAKGAIWSLLTMFGKVFVVAFLLVVLWIILQYVLAGLVSKRKPFTALYQMLPVFVTAFGTQSSAATIPVTLKHVKKMGVSKRVAEFVVPLSATINVSAGTVVGLLITVCIAHITGLEIGYQSYVSFIFMMGIACVAAPGVPGGFTMMMISLTSSMLGFDAAMQGLVMVLLLILDGVNTACNVTSDGALAMMIDRLASERLPNSESVLKEYNEQYQCLEIDFDQAENN